MSTHLFDKRRPLLFRFPSNVEETDLRNRKRTYEALRRLPEAYWSRRVQVSVPACQIGPFLADFFLDLGTRRFHGYKPTGSCGVSLTTLTGQSHSRLDHGASG